MESHNPFHGSSHHPAQIHSDPPVWTPGGPLGNPNFNCFRKPKPCKKLRRAGNHRWRWEDHFWRSADPEARIFSWDKTGYIWIQKDEHGISASESPEMVDVNLNNRWFFGDGIYQWLNNLYDIMGILQWIRNMICVCVFEHGLPIAYCPQFLHVKN